MNVQNFISNLEEIVMVEPGTITLDTVLEELEGWDSLAKVALTTDIEEEYNVKINQAMLNNVNNVNDLVNLIKSCG
jgi:acyl carrier protein